MKEKYAAKIDGLNGDRLKAAVRSTVCHFNDEEFQAFSHDVAIFTATITSGCTLYMPSGYVFVEKAMSLTLGFFARVLVPGDELGNKAIAAEGDSTCVLAGQLLKDAGPPAGTAAAAQ